VPDGVERSDGAARLLAWVPMLCAAHAQQPQNASPMWSTRAYHSVVDSASPAGRGETETILRIATEPAARVVPPNESNGSIAESAEHGVPDPTRNANPKSILHVTPPEVPSAGTLRLTPVSTFLVRVFW